MVLITHFLRYVSHVCAHYRAAVLFSCSQVRMDEVNTQRHTPSAIVRGALHQTELL